MSDLIEQQRPHAPQTRPLKEKPGYKKTKLGWIPKEWEVMKFEQIFETKQGVQSPVEDQFLDKLDGMVRFIRIVDITSSNEPMRYINDPGHKHWVSHKDLFMVRYGTPGLVVQGFEGVIANNMFRLLPKGRLDRSFYKYFFQSQAAVLMSLATSSTMPALNFTALNSMRLICPPLPEQQKIATILSTWDKAINTLQNLIDKKQERKKGLMQQLLTGKNRFDGFTEEWSEVTVDEAFDFLSTTSFSRNDLEYTNNIEQVNYIHYGDIHATYDQILLGIDGNEDVPVLKEEVKLPGRVDYLKDGDLVIADASEDYKGVADCIELQNLNDRKVIAGLHTFALRDSKGLTVPGIRGYLLKTKSVVKRMRQIATGSKVYGVSKKNIATVSLNLPSILEQQKIASVLSAADAEIKKLQTQLNKLQEQKKGLMQKLLTGEVRVKTN